MATELVMPKLGAKMNEGTIIEWKKKEGERVEKGESICVIKTAKVAFEVEAPESGILAKIVSNQGDTVPVGGPLAYILQQGENLGGIPESRIKKREAKRRRGSERPYAVRCCTDCQSK
jgi:pyruvate/2-oxoglutarate dehydrogenase complex dihydrolipoamide acyltransferase (E2) component